MQKFPIFAYNISVMKKSILTAFIIMLGAMGLMAQSKRADSAKKPKSEAKAEAYTLTHQDSTMMERAIINYRAQPPQDILVPNSTRLLTPAINDVIDVEHEIK
jgi:hypothetical protein